MSREHLMWVQKYLTEAYQTPILENFLGLHLLEIDEGKVSYTIDIADRHCNWYGSVHGGTLASISDIAMGVSCVTLGKRVVTIDMNVGYIRSAPPGSTLVAVGEVVGNGRTIMRASGEIRHNGQLLVKSQATYFVTGLFIESDNPKPVDVTR